MASTGAPAPDHPHERGADRVLGASADGLTRSTPTSVGRTRKSQPYELSVSEHPHERGADNVRLDRNVGKDGAPPRAWGGRGLCRRRLDRQRSTPTSVGRTGEGVGRADAVAEHPHERGADVGTCPVSALDHGAPPRAWGGRLATGDGRRVRRSTPTSVGRTRAAASSWSASTEHPHERGADSLAFRGERPQTGAPPRAWGGLHARRWRSPTSSEHPHERGADLACHCAICHLTGAPPRAWGGRAFELQENLAIRSTPTSVGRTKVATARTPTMKEHPHERGADFSRNTWLQAGGGAPPRAWGGRNAFAWHRRGGRSTPTSVGRTRPSPAGSRSSTEHPHERGADAGAKGPAAVREGAPPRAVKGVGPCIGSTSRRHPEHPHERGADGNRLIGAVSDGGAPPRAWGGPQRSWSDARPQRSTPTSVGRTGIGARRRRPSPEHPHERGADHRSQVIADLGNGAPPRAWGGRPDIPRQGGDRRSTPTSVGRTLRCRWTLEPIPEHPHVPGG